MRLTPLDGGAGAAAPANEPEVEEPVAAEPPAAEHNVRKKEVSFQPQGVERRRSG